MTTAVYIINDALSEIGVIGVAETPSAEDTAFCLRKLNQILQRLSNSRQMLPVSTGISITLTSQQNYLVGPGGATVTARPIKVTSATATDSSGLESPVSVATQEVWDSIANKNTSGGPPTHVWYEALNTNGRVWVYPKAPGYTLNLDCLTLLTNIPNPSTDITLPEGYDSVLTLMLADDIAPAFGKQTSPDTRRRLNAALATVRATNLEPLYLSLGMAGQSFQFERGY